jgi:serine/threonine protein kinase
MINLKVGKNAMANKNLIQFEEGDLVDGRYKIIKSLGEGGMASVWKAYDIKTDTEVAIKMAKLPTESEGIKKSRSRYKNELAGFCCAKFWSPCRFITWYVWNWVNFSDCDGVRWRGNP